MGGGRELGHNKQSLGHSSAGAEGGKGRGMLWHRLGSALGAEPPLPSQPTLNHSNTGTSHAAHPGELTGSSHGPSMGDTAAHAGPGSVRGPTATKHPSMGHRMDTGPGEMVQDWDSAVLGMVPAGPCLAAQTGAEGRCQWVGAPGCCSAGRGQGQSPGPLSLTCLSPAVLGKGGGRGRRAHQRALWSLMKAVLSLWAS